MYINKKLRNVSFASPISVPSVDDVASLNGRGRVLSFSFFSFVVLSSKHIQTVLCLQGSGPMVATQQVVSRTDLIYFLTLCNFSPRSIDFLYIFNQEGFSECVGKSFLLLSHLILFVLSKSYLGGVWVGGVKKKKSVLWIASALWIQFQKLLFTDSCKWKRRLKWVLCFILSLFHRVYFFKVMVSRSHVSLWHSLLKKVLLVKMQVFLFFFVYCDITTRIY